VAITSKYILVCDEVRQENTGKFLIIGLYTPDMTVPQLPFLLPHLTFFVALETDRPGNYGFRLQLQHLDSGARLADGMGGFGVLRPGMAVFPIRMQNIQIAASGSYMLSISIDGEREPITTSFNVILNIPAQQQGLNIPPQLPR
jgi:hypothetical protein